MSWDRRKFLKAAGVGALAGMGWQLLRPGALDAAELIGKYSPNPSQMAVKPGGNWGMAIDLTKLDDAARQAAAEACNIEHNVPHYVDAEGKASKQDIKWIWEAEFDQAFVETENPYAPSAVLHNKVLVLCNHCQNPPCVRVCPTQATFKREDGIVMMDMHRCIGCRFCMAACPYGSRSFNFKDPRAAYFNEKDPKTGQPRLQEVTSEYPTRTKGVVEKCTFCAERLAVGLQPACVAAAPGVMFFGDMSDAGSPVRAQLNKRFSIRRKPNLGTEPQVFYLI